MSDRRSHFANARVAHSSLRGHVEAERFTDGTWMRVTKPVADLLAAPGSAGPDRQVIWGEPFHVLEIHEGLAFGRCGLNGHAGYLSEQALGEADTPTHRVKVRQTLGFSRPDFKDPQPVGLSIASRLRVTGETGRFLETTDGMFIPKAHLAPLDTPESDPVAVAERLVGTPYLWGGNSHLGLDCSGLVQVGMQACDHACPGDSDQQLAQLGPLLPEGTEACRGDLMFWKGHVAWVAGPDMLLHANAYHMAVAYEPLKEAITRIIDQGDGSVIGHIRPLE
ncbi:NlpC/P60 family protein [Heliomarina baculiformis]|uniref:C40 family peptidase n=1 Tax=Heliomarina baculiformis TaxID=2872036 RepID=UPI001EE22839